MKKWMFLLPSPIWMILLGWEKFHKLKGKKIAVLGMKGSGKTRFYRFLQNKPYSEKEDFETIKEQYEGFDYIKSDSTEIRIRGGWDYGGSKELATLTNERLIAESDIVFFLFDFFTYGTNPNYRDETNARLSFIRKSIGAKEFLLFGTHVDLFEKQSTVQVMKKEFEIYLNKSGFSPLIKTICFALIDMTDNQKLRLLIDKIF